VRGWKAGRQAAGVAVVSALVVGVVFAGLRTREPKAATIAVAAETAWILDPAAGRVVLADAVSARAVTAVAMPAGAYDFATAVQTDRSAVVVAGINATFVDGRTWQAHPVGSSDGVFAASGPAAAWVVDPNRGTAHRLADGGSGASTVPVGAGAGPDRLRVGADGTLWFLDGEHVRGVRGGDVGGDVDVPLGPPASDPLLTLVDERPVVVDGDRARVIDPASGTVTATWPLPGGATAGPLARLADRSERTVALTRGTNLVLVGADGATTVDLGPPGKGPIPGGALSAPVSHNGRLFVADGRGGVVVAVDPSGGPSPRVTRVPVGPPGAMTLFAHHGRLWFTLRPDNEPSRAGTVGTDGGVRVIRMDPGTGGVGDPADAADRVPSDPPGPRDGDEPADRPPNRPPLNRSEDGCGGNVPRNRCLPSGRAAPDATLGEDRAGPLCPRSWPTASCREDGRGEDGRSSPEGGPEADAPRIRFTPEAPKPGDDVQFSSDAGALPHSWTFEGTDPRVSDQERPARQWPRSGSYRVTLAVPGRPDAQVDVPVGRQLPDVRGLPRSEARTRLEAAGLIVADEARRRPSLWAENHVEGLRAGDRELNPGPLADDVTQVALDVSDGTLPVVSVAVGYKLTCAVIADGTVRCWGDPSAAAAIGAGPGQDTSRPVRVANLTDVESVAIGDDHACAVVRGGTVRCWGDNVAGQLGRPGSASPIAQPVAGLTDVVAVTAGPDTTCALQHPGTVWCWGRPTEDPFGIPPGADFRAVRGSPTPQPVRLPTLVDAIATQMTHTCAIAKRAGELWCWGEVEMEDGGVSKPTPPRLFATVPGGIDGVAPSPHYDCVTAAGRLLCRGSALPVPGRDPMAYSDDLVPIPPAAEFTSITSSWAGMCGRRGNGTLVCWSQSYRNNGAKDPGLQDVVQVATSGQICAVRGDRSLTCWIFPGWSASSPGQNDEPTRVPVTDP
jgi:hypothetical protein